MQRLDNVPRLGSAVTLHDRQRPHAVVVSFYSAVIIAKLQVSHTQDSGFSSYPHCITHVYKDTKGAATALSGYTLLGCAVAAGTDSVYYNPFIFSTSSSSTRRSANSEPTTTPGLLNPTSSTSARATTTVTQTPSATSVPAATPVGAIAGGVVGGVAAISLVIFGIWFLIRQNKKHKDETPSPGGPPPPGYNTGPMGGTPATQMSQNSPPAGGYFGQQHQPEIAPVAGFAAVAPMHQRSSIAKPPYTGYDHTPGGGAFGNSPTPPASPPLPQAPPYSGVQSTPSPPLPAERHYSYSSSQQPGGGGYGASSPGSYQQSSQNAGYAGYHQQQDGGYQSRPDGEYQAHDNYDNYRQSQSTQGGHQPGRDSYQPPPPPQQDGYPQRSEGAYQPHQPPLASQGGAGGGYPPSQPHGGYQQPQPPPSSYQPPQPVYQPYPTGGYPSGGHTHELSTARGDGEVRELQG